MGSYEEHTSRAIQYNTLADIMKNGTEEEVSNSMRLFPEPYIEIMEDIKRVLWDEPDVVERCEDTIEALKDEAEEIE